MFFPLTSTPFSRSGYRELHPSKELAPYGIRVNAVAPGFIATDMVDKLPEDKKEQYLEEIPLKRFGRPEEVGDVVAMLASDACSYLTGQVIVLDGGLSL